MSERDLEIVRRAMLAFQGDAAARVDAPVHPDVEYDATVRPGGKVWHGPAGARQAMLEWTAGWSDWTLEVEQMLDAGDGRVVVLWRERGRAEGSGAEMSQEGATVITVRGGLVVSVVVEVDRRAALAEVGLDAEG